MKSRKQAGARRANRKRLSVLVCPRSGPPLGLNLRRPSIWDLMEFLRAGCFWFFLTKKNIYKAIAAHSHLRWPVLSREWIRRQQARIARVDWESRLPVLLGPRKSRLSLLIRKQQKLLNKAREMEGVPDLNVRLSLVEGDANVEPSAQNSTKKAAGKAKKRIAEGEQSASLEEIVPLEETPISAEASKVSKKKQKKKDGKKRPREDPSIDQNEASTVVREDNTGGPAQTGSTEASPEERPKKRANKKSVEEGARRSVDGDHPDNLPASEDPSRSGGKASGSDGDPRSESPSSERAVPTSATRKGVQSEGSLSKRARVKFPDRVDFMYDEKMPLVFNPLQCAELTRQIRGGMRELPPIGDLYFKDKYIDAAFTRKRYDSALKQTMIQLGAAEKLARTRLSAIERLWAENKKANDKAAEEKEVLRVKFEELPSPPSLVEGDANVEPSAQNPTKKAAGKTKKCIAEGEQSASLEDSVPLEEALSSADASMVSKKKKKKKDGKKRPREDLSIDQNEGLIVIQEDNTGGPAQTGSTEASPEERPKKRAKKKSVEDGARRSIDGDHPDDLPASEDPSRSGGKASGSKGDPRSESPSSERAVPTSATRKGVQSEGSLSKWARVEFPDRVEFMYDEKTPLVFNPLQCAELTRQIRGGTRELPPIGDLYFKHEYIDAAFTRKRVTY
ncbi:hypothetical protein F2Q69_00030469 [Brassica cretica]|uniref:Uncharacterized protein n=1 Tax=Brassica cretica TaxID=69181 RepID=A0A8S9RXJ2_BRACR|nr:hypothetical protein F2Q69_00030469 [Brassica cretica]